MAEDEVTRKLARHTVSPRERKNILKIGPNLAATFVAALTIALPAAAQDTGTRTPETLSGAYTGKVYPPYAHRGFPERPLWGDSHLHTSLSMDAGLFGNRLPPRDRGIFLN